MEVKVRLWTAERLYPTNIRSLAPAAGARAEDHLPRTPAQSGQASEGMADRMFAHGVGGIPEQRQQAEAVLTRVGRQLVAKMSV